MMHSEDNRIFCFFKTGQPVYEIINKSSLRKIRLIEFLKQVAVLSFKYLGAIITFFFKTSALICLTSLMMAF